MILLIADETDKVIDWTIVLVNNDTNKLQKLLKERLDIHICFG